MANKKKHKNIINYILVKDDSKDMYDQKWQHQFFLNKKKTALTRRPKTRKRDEREKQ